LVPRETPAAKSTALLSHDSSKTFADYSVTGSVKRPIYWHFDSGKRTLQSLIYMHRYDENTIGNLRIDYLHRMERVL
jgi:hypothetical protein